MSDWLKNLKSGDKVFVSGNYGKSLEIVQKITPTGRIVVNNIQYINGVNQSDMWCIYRLEQAKQINEILNLGVQEEND